MNLSDLSDDDFVREVELNQARIDRLKVSLRRMSEELAEATEEERVLLAELDRRADLQPVQRIQDLPVGSVCEVEFCGDRWVLEIQGFSCHGAMVNVCGSGPDDVTSRGALRCEDLRLIDVFPQEVPQ